MKEFNFYNLLPARSLYVGLLSLLMLVSIGVTPLCAQTIYVSQSGAGSQNGSSAGNAYAMSWMTTSGNWGSGSGQIGPGATVMLEGSISSSFTILGSGSAGNPITIKFDTGAYMSAPNWTSGQAILAIGQSWLVIDGGGTNNGAIFSTATGYGLAYGSPNNGIAIEDCRNVTVQNIAVTNIYIPVQNQESDSSSSSCVFIYDSSGVGSQNITVSNVLVHDAGTGFGISFGTGTTNINFFNINAYNCNWGGIVSDLRASSVCNGVVISNCWLHTFNCWNDPADNNHHNGVFAFTANGGQLTNVTIASCVFGGGFGGSFQTSGLFVKGNVGSLLCVNNVFDSTDGSACGSGLAFIQIAYETYHYSEGIFNNTFLGQNGNNNTGILVGDLSDDNFPPVHNPNYQISNNIFSGLYAAVSLAYYNGSYTVSEDYNLTYGNAAGNTWMGGPAGSMGQVTLAQWQSSGRELHLLQGNPLLNSSSFKPQSGSAAIAAGANLSGVFSVDKLGLQRPQSWAVGAYELPSSAALVTQLLPATAASAGAQWQLDGGALQTSGTALTNLAAGMHVVGFAPIPGWITPSNQPALVTSTPANVTASYVQVPQSGGVQVAILPAAAVAAGAAWQTNGGAFLPSGTALNPVPVGNLSVAFSSVPGWTAPPPEVLVVSNNQWTQITNIYWKPNLGVVIHYPNNTSGLALWWPLDDGAGVKPVDLSGNGFTGTLVNNGAWTPGEITNAVSFSAASDQYLTAGSGPGTLLGGATSATISAWIKTTSTFSFGFADTTGHRFFVSSAGSIIYWVAENGSSSYPSSSYTFDGNWHWITMVFNAGTITGYIDGAPQTITPGGASPASSLSSPLGSFDVAMNPSGSAYYSQSADDVRIYNRALSSTEITNLYQWPTGVRR
ncbi:MAG TPA: LamG domain-containing protein [Verrucomicrobiae bacterium]|jgi:hypothetical protein